MDKQNERLNRGVSAIQLRNDGRSSCLAVDHFIDALLSLQTLTMQSIFEKIAGATKQAVDPPFVQGSCVERRPLFVPDC